MNVDLTLALPATLDVTHLALAGLALLLLIGLLIKGSSGSNNNGNDNAAEQAEQAEPEPQKPVPAQLKETSPEAALQLLTLLQQDGRLIDFLNEDLAGFSDADIGAAARVVHEGCSKTLKTYVELTPVRSENEESRITLEAGFDATETRLTGNVVGEPPFQGTLIHRGWKATSINLPKLAEGHNTRIVAPAEVEL